jgi:hypothetical protein
MNPHSPGRIRPSGRDTMCTELKLGAYRSLADDGAGPDTVCISGRFRPLGRDYMIC